MNLLRRRKRLLALGLIVTVIAVWVSFRPGTGGEDVKTAVAAPPVKVVAQSGSVVSAEGEIVPLEFTDLSFQSGGVVAEILVEEGEQVVAGDPLIQLESTDLEIALQQSEARLVSAEAGLVAAQNRLALAQAGIETARAQLASAEANLALTRSGPLPQEVAAAEENLAVAEASVVQAAGNRDAALDIATEAQIQAAQANLSAATAELRRIEEQYEAILDACFETPQGEEVCPLYGPVEEETRRQLEVAQAREEAARAALNRLQAGPTETQQRAANSAVIVAQANRDVAQANLDLLLAGSTAEEIAIAEVEVERAQVGVDTAEVNVAEAEAAVTQAEAALENATAAVASTQAALDRMTLVATFDGTVADIDTNVGELVGASVPVVTLADFSAWQVETTDLTELDVARVREGAGATVRIDAIPNETVAGIVTDIALVSSLSRGDVVYDVTIQLDERPDLPLRWGMTVFADIDAE